MYSVGGAGEPALVFIHGGLADRSFFDRPLREFAPCYRVAALDLAGHGESGENRVQWGLPQFGADVAAVLAAEQLRRVILFGNSLGGPAAIEAALLEPDRVIGVVGIDTFQRIEDSIPIEEAQQRAAAFRTDYAANVKNMVTSLFHPNADPALLADAERRMKRTSPTVAREIFLSLGGYQPAASVRKLTVPLRAINGDLFPTDVDSVRKIKDDFDVIVMQHTGHYPMLERPDEFHQHVATTVQELSSRKCDASPDTAASGE